MSFKLSTNLKPAYHAVSAFINLSHLCNSVLQASFLSKPTTLNCVPEDICVDSDLYVFENVQGEPV